MIRKTRQSLQNGERFWSTGSSTEAVESPTPIRWELEAAEAGLQKEPVRCLRYLPLPVLRFQFISL